jgi:hypothetical protein
MAGRAALLKRARRRLIPAKPSVRGGGKREPTGVSSNRGHRPRRRMRPARGPRLFRQRWRRSLENVLAVPKCRPYLWALAGLQRRSGGVVRSELATRRAVERHDRDRRLITQL